MPLAEDFSVFFNEAEHAVPATFKTPQGAVVGEASVILSLPVQEMQVGAGGEVAHLQPSVLCKAADVGGVKKNYTVEAGGDTYRVVRREADGTGLVTLFIAKQ